MPSLTTLTSFAVIVAAFAAVPGPSNLYVVAQGLRGGLRAAEAAAAGCASAAATYVAATVFGLAALLSHAGVGLAALHYLGGAYLLYLGVRTWRAAGRPPTGSDGRDTTGSVSFARALGRGYVVELSNPKVALFFVAFLPQFVHDGDGPVTGQLLVLGALFCVIGFLCASLYAAVSGTIRRSVRGHDRSWFRITRCSALLYVGLGGWSIWSGTRVRAAS